MAFYPVFVAGAPRYDGYTNTLAAHEDWSALVTSRIQFARRNRASLCHGLGLSPLRSQPANPDRLARQPAWCNVFVHYVHGRQPCRRYAGLLRRLGATLYWVLPGFLACPKKSFGAGCRSVAKCSIRSIRLRMATGISIEDVLCV